MGTRADFYIGTGEKADWLGSIAWGGYPGSRVEGALTAKTADDFKEQVQALLDDDDGTKPEHGWPWPWENSHTTDYAYAWDPERGVLVSCFGSAWVPWNEYEAMSEDQIEGIEEKAADVPDMSSRSAFTTGKRSGILIIGG
jgi:hypothetical protein